MTNNHLISSRSNSRPILPTVSRSFIKIANQPISNTTKLSKRLDLPTVSETFTQINTHTITSNVSSISTRPSLPIVSKTLVKTISHPSASATVHISSKHKFVRKNPPPTTAPVPNHSRYVFNKVKRTGNAGNEFRRTHLKPEPERDVSSVFKRTHFISKAANVDSSSSTKPTQTQIIKKYSLINKSNTKAIVGTKRTKTRYKVNNAPASTSGSKWSKNTQNKWHAQSYSRTVITRRKSTENRFKISKIPLVSVS